MTPTDPNREQLLAMARKLRPLLPDLVLVGGTATGLLITDPAGGQVRPTVDVDVITEFTSYAKYAELGERLLSLGFQHDTTAGAPTCRWVIDEMRLDVMSTKSSILGFSNCWYALAIKTSILLKLEDQIDIRMINAPCFIATKLEAFSARSGQDFGNSKDLEDIVTVIDGRPELIDELRSATPELRTYVAEKFCGLIADRAFLDTIPGYLLPDAASQARVGIVIERLQSLATLT